MKKILLFMGFMATLFCGCDFSETTFDPILVVDTPVVSGFARGPFGDSAFKDIVSVSEMTGKVPDLSHGNVFYISPDGNDNNPGSETAPFKTFEKALKQFRGNNAGGTIYVKTGSKTHVTGHRCDLLCQSESRGDIKLNFSEVDVPADFTENLRIKDVHGNANSYITIASAPGNTEKPIISIDQDGSDKKIVYIKNSSYIRLSGLRFWASYGNGAEGIKFSDDYESDANHIIIDNCDFRYITVSSKSENGHGISMSGNSAKYSINNVLVFNNTFEYMLNGRSECVTAVANVENINIIKNTINKTGNIGIDIGGNYRYCKDENGNVCKERDFARYVYVAKNTVSNEISAYDQTAYAIYADGGQHIQIVGNKVFDCTGAFEIGAEEPCGNYPTADVLIKGNEIENRVKDANFASRCHVFQIGGYDSGNDGYVKIVRIDGNHVYIDADITHSVFDFSKCQSVTIVNNEFEATSSFKGYVFEHKEKAIVRNNTYTNIREEDD